MRGYVSQRLQGNTQGLRHGATPLGQCRRTGRRIYASNVSANSRRYNVFLGIFLAAARPDGPKAPFLTGLRPPIAKMALE